MDNILQSAMKYLSGLVPSGSQSFDYRSPERIRAEGALPGMKVDPKNDPNSMKLTVNSKSSQPSPSPEQEAIKQAIVASQPPAPVSNDGFRFAYETLARDQGWTNNGPRPNFQPKQPPADIGNIIRKIFPNEATQAAAVAVSEDGNFNPRGENLWNGEGMGIDRGIFAINSNTFNGLMSRQGDKLRKMGINSFEDMYDPEKNAMTAKLIREGARDYRPKTNPEGWGGWFGWQDTGFDLNKGYYTKDDRVQYELAKKIKQGKK